MHSNRSIRIGILSLLLTILTFLLLSYFGKNNESFTLMLILGLLALFTAILSLAGLIYAIISFREKRFFKSLLGIFLNLFFGIVISLIILLNVSDIIKYFL